MPMSVMEVLTLLLVIFAALSYLDNHKKKQHPEPSKVWMLFLNTFLAEGNRKCSDHFLSRLYIRLPAFASSLLEFWKSDLKSHIRDIFIKAAGGRRSHLFPSFTERMIIMEMVTWSDLFLFITMLVAILTYIDRRHKKQPSCSPQKFRNGYLYDN